MAGPNNSYIKKQKTEKRLKKRREKEQKKQFRRDNSPGGGLENMMAYVDKFGNITNTPPEMIEESKEKESGNKQ